MSTEYHRNVFPLVRARRIAVLRNEAKLQAGADILEGTGLHDQQERLKWTKDQLAQLKVDDG